jgi:hypothetical protein
LWPVEIGLVLDKVNRYAIERDLSTRNGLISPDWDVLGYEPRLVFA